jgi:hypothetical protein
MTERYILKVVAEHILNPVKSKLPEDQWVDAVCYIMAALEMLEQAGMQTAEGGHFDLLAAQTVELARPNFQQDDFAIVVARLTGCFEGFCARDKDEAYAVPV